MKSFKVFGIAVIATLAALIGQASATTITVGSVNSGGDCTFPCMQELQQSYNKTLFSGPMNISQINFFRDGGSLNATYTLSLSYMNGSFSSISTNLAGNIGAGAQVFSTQVFSNLVENSPGYNAVSFFGSFNYDPTQGDLLLRIVQSNPTGPNNGTWATYSGPDLGRAYKWMNCPSCGISAHTGYGITTQFIGGPIASNGVPAPGALALLGLGLLGIAGLRRRKAA